MGSRVGGLEGAYCVPRARLTLIASVLIYAAAIVLGQQRYLSIEHAFWGFNQPNYDPLSLIMMVVLLILPVSVMPLYFNRVSSLFIYALTFFVYVPALVIGTLNAVDAVEQYGYLFSAFSIGLFVCSLLVRSGPARQVVGSRPSGLMIGFAVLGSLACGVILYVTYRDVIYFAGLSEVYAQRARGAATSLYIGYCQVYLAYFFSPILFAYGVLYKRFTALLLGFFGFVLVYMITAERTVILLPFMLWGVAKVFRKSGLGALSTCGLFVFGAVLIVLISLLYQESTIVSELGVYVFMRLIAIPGLFVTQYYDLFSAQGYTHWAHVSVIGSLIEIPAAYVGDEKWPALGKILAERVLGIQSQSNAGFIATDGVAAWGSFGVIVVCLLYSGWLMVLDKVSKGWDQLFLLTALFPLAFVSTNGSLFTMLTSFGGALWIVLLGLNKYRFIFGRGRND